MKLCGFVIGRDESLFSFAGRTLRVEYGVRRNDGDATPASGAGLRCGRGAAA